MTAHAPLRVLELRSVRGTGGGPEKTILLGTARTNPARYAVTVCYIRDRRDDVFHIDRRAGDLPIDYVEVRERGSFDPGIWRPLRDVVRDRRIQIVHAHDYKTDFLALLLGLTHPVIPLSTVHGWSGHSKREVFGYYPADRRLLTRYPHVIAVSSDIKHAIVRSGAKPERITVVPNGIDHGRYVRNPEHVGPARSRLGVGPSDFVMGAVGRLEREKNYPLLLQAFSRVAGRFPSARLVIAGDGSLRPALERLAATMGATETCRFVGHLPDVIGLHHALDLFVMCSDNEGSPNAVLEAMALETPVVATRVGGVGDLIVDGLEGLLVPRRDVDALAAALEASLSNRSSARERAAAARRKVEQQLSFERRMARVERIYDALLDRYGDAVQSRGRWWRS
jgi:glycosyltransferase involved in cell wall biosynthesis